MPTAYQTIIRPLVTEKSQQGYHEHREYHFEVHPDANKIAIKQAVEQLFGVKVTGVWTMNQRGKTRRVGKTVGARSNWKKAIVKLREGDTIEIFEG
ncbi:MAG TPA: 50S ribosomal protein L23 [Pyrinomonadaceae bacterium]